MATFDRRGFMRAMRRTAPLYRWFRPTVEGIDNIPPVEGALVVTNHGSLGLDLPVFIRVIYDNTGRVLRSLGDRVVFATPGFREAAAQMGIIEGQPDAAVRLLKNDQLVLVYPGGAAEALCEPNERYKLQWEHSLGFVRTALRAQKPIIPVASVGNAELYKQIASRTRVRRTLLGKFITRYVGDKYVLPLYMGLGAWPLPKRIHYVIGEPIRFPYEPQSAHDEDIVRACHAQATAATQQLLDEGRARWSQRCPGT